MTQRSARKAVRRAFGDDGTMCQYCYRPATTRVMAHRRSLWRWALRRPRRSVRVCVDCVRLAVADVRAHR